MKRRTRFRGDLQVDGTIFGGDGKPIGGSAYGPPIDWEYEGTIADGDDDFALTKKIHLPTEAKLYLVTAQIPAYAYDDAPSPFSGSITVIENAAHWDHWWGDGSHFDYPTSDAVSVQVVWPGGGQGGSFGISQSVIAGGGWYIFAKDAYITSICPIA